MATVMCNGKSLHDNSNKEIPSFFILSALGQYDWVGRSSFGTRVFDKELSLGVKIEMGFTHVFLHVDPR